MIIKLWQKLSKFPCGKWFFSKVLGLFIPYTGSISPQVIELQPGKAHVRMRDRRRVRNHLKCVHAIALMNLGEVTTGLAVTSTLPNDVRYILVHLEIDFIRKARGTLDAYSQFQPPVFPMPAQKAVVVESEIKDQSQMVVAKVKAHWLLGPKEKK